MDQPACDDAISIFSISTEHLEPEKEKRQSSFDDQRQVRGHMFGNLLGGSDRGEINAPFRYVFDEDGRFVVQKSKEELDKYQSPESLPLMVRTIV
ncbi:hypothetical protein ACHAPD_007819 [Fusarium lateritium]